MIANSGYNHQMNGTKENLVAKLTSKDEPQKIKKEEEMNEETSYHINQNDEQRMKTQGSCIEGKENEKSLNTNSNIKNTSKGDEENKTTSGPTEE